MKRTVLSIILSLITVLSCMSALTGCKDTNRKSKDNESNSLALSIVLGVHQNFPKLTFASNKIQESVYEACYSYGDVIIVTVEGKPVQWAYYGIDKPDKSITDTKRRQLARQTANSIICESSCIAATSEETDTLAALQLAANSLQSSESSNKQLYVYDSGLCTSGLLNQTKNDVLSADPAIVVEKLAATHSLPDLNGIEVKWIGLACVAGEQDTIPDSYKYKIEMLWNEIIVASGGSVRFDSMHISGDESEGLPDVTTISFAKDALDVDFAAENVMSSPIKFGEETVKFKPDSSSFFDANVANKALEPIAEVLKANPNFNIVIAGTTASVGDGYKLSMERAEACKRVLVSMGANQSQIECIGLGSSKNCFHIDDLDENGQLIEEYAKLNRAIYIFSSTSDTAKQFNDI